MRREMEDTPQRERLVHIADIEEYRALRIIETLPTCLHKRAINLLRKHNVCKLSDSIGIPIHLRSFLNYVYLHSNRKISSKLNAAR